MTKIQEKKKKEEERIYTTGELQDFDKELGPYRIDAIMPDGRKAKYLSVGGEYSYLQVQGKVKSAEKISPEMRGMSKLPQDMQIVNNLIFAEHENKMRQYWNWLGRMQFGQERRLEQLNIVAVEMGFPDL